MMSRQRPLAALALVTVLPCTTLSAQTTTSVPDAPPAVDLTPAPAPTGGRAPVPVILAAEPILIEALGMSIALPEGAQATTGVAAGVDDATAMIFPGEGEAKDWIITIQSRTSSNSKLSLRDVADQSLEALKLAASRAQYGADEATIRQLKASGGAANAPLRYIQPGATEAEVIAREPAEGQQLRIASGDSVERFYIAFPARPRQRPVVRGATFAQIAPNRFVLIELFTTDLAFEQSRLVYETMVATATFSNAQEASQQRATLVRAGVRLFDDISEDDLASVVALQPERWERLYRPARSGNAIEDEEVGYRRIRTSIGPRREVDADGLGRGIAANTEGFIVRMDARLLQPGGRGERPRVIDSRSVFFMTPDRSDETWKLDMMIKDEAGTARHSEVGARTDDQMTVRVETQGNEPRNVFPQIAGDGYISRVESFLLPQLLVRERAAAAYGFYAYRSEAQTIQFRRDVLEQPKESGSPWRLVSRLAEGQPEQVMLLDAEGRVLRSELPGGVISEPIELRELLDLWKRKGLPTE